MKKETIELIKNFVHERNWEQFHTGENLAKSLVIEASELLELYQWSDETKSIDDLKDELADVIVYAIMLANKYEFDIDDIIVNKMSKNALKYPVEKAKGSNKKYNEL